MSSSLSVSTEEYLRKDEAVPACDVRCCAYLLSGIHDGGDPRRGSRRSEAASVKARGLSILLQRGDVPLCRPWSPDGTVRREYLTRVTLSYNAPILPPVSRSIKTFQNL